MPRTRQTPASGVQHAFHERGAVVRAFWAQGVDGGARVYEEEFCVGEAVYLGFVFGAWLKSGGWEGEAIFLDHFGGGADVPAFSGCVCVVDGV